MSEKFSEREKGFEKKFARDEELQFKVQARSNKYIAEFVSKKLNKTEDEKQKYIQEQNKMQWYDPIILQENGAAADPTAFAAAGAGGPEVQSEVQQQYPRNRMIEDMMCSVLWSYIVSKLKEETSRSEGSSTSTSQAPQGCSSIRRPQGGSSG